MLRDEIAGGEALGMEQALSFGVISPHGFGRDTKEILLRAVVDCYAQVMKERLQVDAFIPKAKQLFHELVGHRLTDAWKELLEVASDDVAVIAGVILGKAADGLLKGFDRQESAVTFAAVHRHVAGVVEVFLEGTAIAKGLPVVYDAVAVRARPNLAEDGMCGHEHHRGARFILSGAHLLPERHKVAGSVPPELSA